MPSSTSELPQLTIKGKTIRVPIIQGGMGIGVSLSPLAVAVASEGGVGIVSSACLDWVVSRRDGKKVNTYEACYREVSLAKSSGGYAGINIMAALIRDYEDSVRGALDAGADVIISGAGLPLSLPSIQAPKDTALVPIVSSARALELLCRKWEKLGHRPDAVVLEGPLAGGHLGFRFDEIAHPSNRLEKLFPPVKDMAQKYGDFPVIVAGGIFDHADIVRFIGMGADGVQMGTRFLATEESSASNAFKQAVLDAGEDDIIIANRPGSPCGLPFRVIRQSPMYLSALKRLRKPNCTKGYVNFRDSAGNLTRCAARESNEDSFCMCNGLLSSAGFDTDVEEPLFSVGTNGSRVTRIVPVKDLMDELAGRIPGPSSERRLS